MSHGLVVQAGGVCCWCFVGGVLFLCRGTNENSHCRIVILLMVVVGCDQDLDFGDGDVFSDADKGAKGSSHAARE